MIHRKLYLAAAAIGVLASVSACSKGKDATPTLNPGQSAPVNGVQDKTSAAVGAVSASTIGANSTGEFALSAATSDMFEIAASKLAVAQTKNPKVKAFAEQMIKDHTASTAKLKGLLPTAAPDVKTPMEMDQRRKGLFDNLKAATKGDFDKVYLAQQLDAHKEAVDLFKGYSEHGDNAAIKDFAASTLPAVQHHRDMAKDLKDSLK